jgi:hypothetical protein
MAIAIKHRFQSLFSRRPMVVSTLGLFFAFFGLSFDYNPPPQDTLRFMSGILKNKLWRYLGSRFMPALRKVSF